MAYTKSLAYTEPRTSSDTYMWTVPRYSMDEDLHKRSKRKHLGRNVSPMKSPRKRGRGRSLF